LTIDSRSPRRINIKWGGGAVLLCIPCVRSYLNGFRLFSYIPTYIHQNGVGQKVCEGVVVLYVGGVVLAGL